MSFEMLLQSIGGQLERDIRNELTRRGKGMKRKRKVGAANHNGKCFLIRLISQVMEGSITWLGIMCIIRRICDSNDKMLRYPY